MDRGLADWNRGGGDEAKKIEMRLESEERQAGLVVTERDRTA